MMIRHLRPITMDLRKIVIFTSRTQQAYKAIVSGAG